MYRKLITSALLSLVVLGGFFADVNVNSEGTLSWVSESYAATTCGGTDQPKCTEDEAIKQKYDEWVLELNQALYFLTFAVSPAVMLAGWLMSPDWTSGELFGIRPVLHDLWVVISNITYFIYAILLIFIALATIFNSQNYGYKKLLPRLALGIVLVPLTWWFVQFIISLSSVVTASVVNIPLEAIIKLEQKKSPASATWLSTPSIPKRIVHDGQFGMGTDLTKGAMKYCKTDPTTCVSPKDILSSSSGMFGGLLVYAYGIFRFQDSFEINTTTDAVKVISQLVHQGIIMALMFLVFGLLVIALIFMLLMRAIKLWFYAIFSPFLTLRYVVGEGLFGGKENADSFDIKEFIGLAFVPALVGLALSFGIVLIAAMHLTGTTDSSKTPTPDCLNTAGGCVVTLMDNPNNQIVSRIISDDGDPYTQTIITFGGVNYVYYGSVGGFSSAMAEITPSALSAAGGIFGTVIIDIIALIFVWSAFMAGKNVSKVAKAAFAPFESLGNKFGKMAMDVPKYTPIPGTGVLSLKSAEKVVNNAEREIERSHDEDFKNSKYGKLFGGDRYISDDGVNRISAAIKSGKESQFKDSVRPYENKAEGHRGKHIEDFRDQLKSLPSDGARREYLTRIGADDATRDKIIGFMQSDTKTKLSHEQDRRELWDLMKAAAGATSSRGANNSSTPFTAAPVIGGTDANKKIELKFNDSLKIQVDQTNGEFSDPEKLKQLKELAKTMTETEFKSRFSGVDQTIINTITNKIKDDFKKVSDGTTGGTNNAQT